MTALILASGKGTRMGTLTADRPKCMTKLPTGETILSRQLRQLSTSGVKKIVITTGAFADILKKYVITLNIHADIVFVHNPEYENTNYIYSMYLADSALSGDVLLMHGDLVFEDSVLDMIIENKESAMTVSTTLPLPEKDFKAVINNDRITAVGIQFMENSAAAQPLYKLLDKERRIWFSQIAAYCNSGETKKLTCYAENAFNEVSEYCCIRPMDFKNLLCSEIDDPSDLSAISAKLNE